MTEKDGGPGSDRSIPHCDLIQKQTTAPILLAHLIPTRTNKSAFPAVSVIIQYLECQYREHLCSIMSTVLTCPSCENSFVDIRRCQPLPDATSRGRL